jgi:predicted esterase
MRLEPDFLHEFVLGSSNRTLLLLHGTGGNERDLIPLGRELDPDASLLSPRGKILETGRKVGAAGCSLVVDYFA